MFFLEEQKEQKNKLTYLLIPIVALIFLFFCALGMLGVAPKLIPWGEISWGADLIGGWIITLEPDPKDVRSIAIDDINTTFSQMRDYEQIRCSSVAMHDKLSISCSTEEQTKKIYNNLSKKFAGMVSMIDVDQKTITIKPSSDMISALQPVIVTKAAEVLFKRIDSGGRKGVTIQKGSNSITISISGSDSEELKKVRSLTQSIAHLSFKLLDLGAAYGTSPEVISGADLTRATPRIDKSSGMASVVCYFNRSGAEKLAYVTSNNIGDRISILLDDKVIQTAVIKGPIKNGTAEITSSSMTYEEAVNLATLFNSGTLPSKLRVSREEIYTPTQGKDFVYASRAIISASFVGICLLLIMRYRILGFGAILSLLLHASLTINALGILGCTLSFAGLAGLAFSMGTAVDGSIIVFESIFSFSKNKIPSPNTISRIADNTVHTAIWSNFTTILALSSLFVTNNAQLKGFAITTSIGLICSSIVTIFVEFTIIKKMSSFIARIIDSSR